MIDLHCHILPELDDGARSLDDSVAMALQADADGIQTVCATPHIRDDHDVRIEGLATRVAALNAELSARGVAARVTQGGEVAQTAADGLTDAQLHDVSLGAAGGWVLLEPAPGALDDRLNAVVERLQERGLQTVLAHPERHAPADLEERLAGLAARGCLIQWTAEFVAQARPDDLVMGLARRGLVHLLGSDAHSALAGRPVRLSEGFARLRAVLTREQIVWMHSEAPAAILRGEPVRVRW
jgi:protein-tyrosine phosphatase